MFVLRRLQRGGLQAQFGGLGHVIQVAQAEVFEKLLGGAVQHRSPDRFALADDGDEIAFQQRLDDAINFHAADRRDIGTANRLA
jgi:hypothetical protein